MIDLSEVHTLCSKSELDLVESSFDPLLDPVTPSDLKSKIKVAQKLHQRCTAMIDLLHSDSRIATTRRKIELFAETIERLESALKKKTAQGVEGLPEKHGDNEAVPEIPDSPDAQARRDDRQSKGNDGRLLSVLARRREQLDPKSGSTRPQSHAGSIPRRQQGRRNSSKNH